MLSCLVVVLFSWRRILCLVLLLTLSCLCLVLFCLVVDFVLSCLVLPCLALPCLVLSCLVLSCLILSYLALSCRCRCSRLIVVLCNAVLSCCWLILLVSLSCVVASYWLLSLLQPPLCTTFTMSQPPLSSRVWLFGDVFFLWLLGSVVSILFLCRTWARRRKC